MRLLYKEEQNVLRHGFPPFYSLDSGSDSRQGHVHERPDSVSVGIKTVIICDLVRFLFLLRMVVLYAFMSSNSFTVYKALCNLDPLTQTSLGTQGHEQRASVSFKCFSGIISCFCLPTRIFSSDCYSTLTVSNVLIRMVAHFKREKL